MCKSWREVLHEQMGQQADVEMHHLCLLNAPFACRLQVEEVVWFDGHAEIELQLTERSQAAVDNLTCSVRLTIAVCADVR